MSTPGPPPANPWVPPGNLLVIEDDHSEGDRLDDLEAALEDRPENDHPVHEKKSLIAWYASDRQQVDHVAPHRRIPAWQGPVNPHLGGLPADHGSAGWWWLGAHGGSGVSTLMQFLPGGADSHRWWPEPKFGGPRAVVLVCRTHLVGLERARDAATQWASADVPAGLLLAGAVAVADAPGRLDRPASEALRMLDGVVPRLWSVPWLDDLRCLPAGHPLPLPPALLPLRSDLAALSSAGRSTSEPRPAALGRGRG